MLYNFLLSLRILEVASDVLMALALVAIAVHECWGGNGWRSRAYKRRAPRGSR